MSDVSFYDCDSCGRASERRRKVAGRTIQHDGERTHRPAVRKRTVLSTGDDLPDQTREQLVSILETIVKDLHKATYLARLRLDVPFDLSEFRLDDAWPTLPALLQHPFLAVGRDVLLKRDQTMKELVFGTQSFKDASELQDRVNTLDLLAVPVRVEVLDM